MNLIDYYQNEMFISIVPAIIAAAASIGSAIAGGIASKRQQRRQNKFNQEQAKYQNSLNIEQWNRENEYNTPVDQMARLKEAGVNPRIWWNGGSNTSASSPTLSAPEQQYNAVGGEIAKGLSDTFGTAINAVNQINQIKMQEAQMDLLKKQAGYYGSMINLNNINANLRNTESLMKQISLNYHDLSERQRVYGKQLAMNNMLASYLNNYGANTLTTNEHGLLSVDPMSFRETPMTTLQRRQIASNIALLDAKALESAWNSRAKKAGISWLGQRMYSEKLKQNLTNGLYLLTYHKRNNEVKKGELMSVQADMARTQMDFLKSQTKRLDMMNDNYYPFLGDISSYFRMMTPWALNRIP